MALNSFSLAANILCIQSLIPVPDYFLDLMQCPGVYQQKFSSTFAFLG